MAHDDGMASVPWLVNDMDALEDAYDQHVQDLIENLTTFLARLDG